MDKSRDSDEILQQRRDALVIGRPSFSSGGFLGQDDPLGSLPVGTPAGSGGFLSSGGATNYSSDSQSHSRSHGTGSSRRSSYKSQMSSTSKKDTSGASLDSRYWPPYTGSPPVSPTVPRTSRQFKNYWQLKTKKSKEPMYPFRDYYLDNVRGPHQDYGKPAGVHPKTHQEYRKYPDPGFLKKLRNKRQRQYVYGEDDTKRKPNRFYGPAEYHQFFDEWTAIGDQYLDPIPAGKALPPDEIDYLRKLGLDLIGSDLIGSGAYGKVWTAIKTNLQTGTKSKVAVKVLNLTKFNTGGKTVQTATSELLHESEVHKFLKHPNICKCGHVFHIHDQITGYPFCRCLIVMELCSGTVVDLLATDRFEEKSAYDMFNEVTAGLKYLHDKNIVHLDLKVSNVLYLVESSKKYIYKLADFGLSVKYPKGDPALFKGLTGTPAYAPPEMIAHPGRKHDAKKCDVYSCGLILAEVLAGLGLFGHIIANLRSTNPNVVVSWGLSQDCIDVLLGMTESDPTQRPTIDEVRESAWFRWFEAEAKRRARRNPQYI